MRTVVDVCKSYNIVVALYLRFSFGLCNVIIFTALCGGHVVKITAGLSVHECWISCCLKNVKKEFDDHEEAKVNVTRFWYKKYQI